MPAAVKEKISKGKKKVSKDAKPSKGFYVEKTEKKRKKGKVVYKEFDVTLFKKGTKTGILTSDAAKKLMGWTENVPKNVEPLLHDQFDKPILCLHNTDNRPFSLGLCTDWKLEILRGKWRLNGETIIIDRTGMVQDGQHRLIGLILAVQEYEKDPELWSVYWKTPPCIEVLVVTGVLEDDDTINSIGVSKPRTRSDVVFRSEMLSDIIVRKDRKSVSSILSYGVKLLWERTAANIGPFRLVPKRSHSGFLDFIARHPRIEECARIIWEMNKEKRSISNFLPLGMASGMMYLMGATASDQDEYIKVNSEEVVNWDNWDKSQEFWKELARKSKLLQPLGERLLAIDSTGVLGSGEKQGMLCKAWDLYLNDLPITEEDIAVMITTDDNDLPILAEHPIMGGLDIGQHEDDEDDE